MVGIPFLFPVLKARTEAIYRRKGLFGLMVPEGYKSIKITAGSMAAGRMAGPGC